MIIVESFEKTLIENMISDLAARSEKVIDCDCDNEVSFKDTFCMGIDCIHYKYKDAFVKRCLANSGDALEMKCYCEALALMEKGKNFFYDCCVGVTIDWDGVIHSKDENWKEKIMLLKWRICIEQKIWGLRLFLMLEKFQKKNGRKCLNKSFVVSVSVG